MKYIYSGASCKRLAAHTEGKDDKHKVLMVEININFIQKTVSCSLFFPAQGNFLKLIKYIKLQILNKILGIFFLDL